MTTFVHQFTDIPYGTSRPWRDTFREFDLYLPRASQTPDDDGHISPILPAVICFIHGGAWRSEDKGDHRVLAHQLVSATQFPVAIPNYRLTPENTAEEDGHIRHPDHAEDILQFLSFLVDWNGLQGLGPPYDPRKIYLMGHSCGAHILASIFLDSSSTSPTLTPSAPLFRAVEAIVMSEGIYDLDLLLSSYPAYREWFVQAAFGKRESYAEISVTAFPLRTPDPQIRWLIIHSRGDTLVNVAQSDAIYAHLCQLHSDVGGRTDRLVVRNINELEEEHQSVLSAKKFIRIVGNFFLTDRL